MTEETLNKSPMQQYIAEFDAAHLNWGYNEYWAYACAYDVKFWNTLFKNEIIFREKFGLNLIWSVEGTQGSGKSQSLIRMKQLIDSVYGINYDIKKFVDQIHFFPEDLEKALSESPKRNTHLLDEQIRVYGMMSRFTEDQLSNYEDTFRKPQINIGYASPSLRRHEHFFIFEAMDNLYVDENDNVSAVDIMLKTRRKSDRAIMPRGILRMRAPEKDLWDAYNDKKDNFIKRMQSNEGGMMKRLEDAADKVIAKYGELLVIETKNGPKLASKSLIFLYTYKVLGTSAYTVAAYELIVEEIRRKVQF